MSFHDSNTHDHTAEARGPLGNTVAQTMRARRETLDQPALYEFACGCTADVLHPRLCGPVLYVPREACGEHCPCVACKEARRAKALADERARALRAFAAAERPIRCHA